MTGLKCKNLGTLCHVCVYSPSYCCPELDGHGLEQPSNHKKRDSIGILPEKLEKKPPIGSATINRKTNKCKNLQRRISCPEDIYEQIYEDIEVSYKK